jgi:hypothetical protein
MTDSSPGRRGPDHDIQTVVHEPDGSTRVWA